MPTNSVLIGIGIAIGIAVGIGIGFGAFASPSNLENQIEEQNAKITALELELKSANERIDTLQKSKQPDMRTILQMMMQNPEMMKQMIDLMMNDQEFMSAMMEHMGSMDSSMKEEMPFNPNAPITIPMIDGYYNGERVFFIHTEVSNKDMATMMTRMINFPTLYVPELVSEENLAKVYVFTNGIRGSGPYGGGPFMFQIDIFDSVPGEEGYSQFRIPYLVTWNDNANPRILTSEEELLGAESKGELIIQKTNNVVNAPTMVWPEENGEKQVASRVERIFESMSRYNAEVININTDNYTVTLKFVKSS